MTLFPTHPSDRVQVFIDGPNTYTAAKSVNLKVNWVNLMSAFKAETRLIRANYFTTVHSNQANDKFYKMLTWLEYQGYTVFEKEVRDNMDRSGNVRSRGTLVGEITSSMVMAANNDTDHLYLFSGDSELCAAVNACKELDTRVTVVSMKHILSDELQRYADEVILLENLPIGDTKDILMDEETVHEITRSRRAQFA